MVKKTNLKPVINFIYLMVLGICFIKEKFKFGCNIGLKIQFDYILTLVLNPRFIMLSF